MVATASDLPNGQSFVMTGVGWDFYERPFDEIGGRHIFITYNQGNLEIMSPSWNTAAQLHEMILLSRGIDETEWAARVATVIREALKGR